MDIRSAILAAGMLVLPGASFSGMPSPGTWQGGVVSGVGGGLRVTPTRLVIEGAQRSAELRLANTGSARAIYRIEFVQMRMRPDGGLDEVPRGDSCQDCADGLVRYSPHQLELDPGEARTVRLRVDRPAGLAPGEYRSHLVARIIPSADSARANSGESSRGVSVELRPVYGIAIPIIVRQGATFARASITGLTLVPGDEGGRAVRFELEREGNRSIHGDVTVTCAGPGGSAGAIGSLRGIAVYVPNARRTLLIPITSEPGRPCPGHLRVEFHEVGLRGVTASSELP